MHSSVRAPSPPAPARGPSGAVYASILIPVSTGAAPVELLEVAAGLAPSRRGTIVLLALSEIPLSEEMDVELPGLETSLRRLDRQARELAETWGVRVQVDHLRTRDQTAAILEEAARRRVDVILVGAGGARSGGCLPRRVGQRVVAEARSRVMFVQAAPAGTRGGAA
jgi:nucleotide-binding universal stress UspA family protein